VCGGSPLQGTVRTAGAKNAMTKLLVAALLSDQTSTFENVPDIGDVATTVALIEELGAEVTWDKEQRTLEVCARHLHTTYIPQRYSGANRIPILLLGALLGRTGQDIIVPTVGGDAIGARPVNFHIEALTAMGAEIEYREMKREGAYLARAPHGLHGALIELPFPSVGATENVLLSAAHAKGRTILKNAAVEPEILDLMLFLQKMGVPISLTGDRTIEIHPLKRALPVRHKVLSDRAEAASFALATAATGGEILIENAPVAHMHNLLHQLRLMGLSIDIGDDWLQLKADGPLHGGLHIETGPYPGFLTDQQQPMVALLTQSQGISVIHETLYENRFGYVQTLKSMGANIELFSSCLGAPCRYHSRNHLHSAVVHGPTALHGAEIVIPDLRAGFAYIIAALIAKDESKIIGLEYIERGYENLIARLQQLGAKIDTI